jgi:ectoine hydroxylase-related dioxygenase (phytanoyl-CoA dioxygenase family)
MAQPIPARAVQRSDFERDGYVCPVPVLTPAETAGFRACYDDFAARHRERLQALPPNQRWQINSDTHFAFEWVDRLTRHPAILDAVERVLGPDLLAWNSVWFVKMPGDPTYISWHQDGAYWGLEPMEVLTAWIALGPATRANGCMRVLPGSHRGPALKQRDTFAPDNALSRGQEIEVAVDEAQAVDLALEPGQMSMHHLWIVHGSDPNRSAVPRVGLAIRYVAAQVRQRDGSRPLAMLVRGENRHGHFTLADQPTRNDGRAGEGVHGQVLQRVREAIEQARQVPA